MKGFHHFKNFCKNFLSPTLIKISKSNFLFSPQKNSKFYFSTIFHPKKLLSPIPPSLFLCFHHFHGHFHVFHEQFFMETMAFLSCNFFFMDSMAFHPFFHHFHHFFMEFHENLVEMMACHGKPRDGLFVVFIQSW